MTSVLLMVVRQFKVLHSNGFILTRDVDSDQLLGAIDSTLSLIRETKKSSRLLRNSTGCRAADFRSLIQKQKHTVFVLGSKLLLIYDILLNSN